MLKNMADYSQMRKTEKAEGIMERYIWRKIIISHIILLMKILIHG